MSYKKLVRDKIPQIIKEGGEIPVTRTLAPDEYLIELGKKAVEEAEEFSQADTIAHKLEELADLQEVIHASLKAIGKTPDELELVRTTKAIQNGIFEDRVYLESVE